MGKIENTIRESIKRDFSSGEIQGVLGFERDDYSKEGIITFVDCVDDIDNLIWSDYCVSNLSKYLIEETKSNKKIGVLLKGCDSLGFEQLISDNRISRENVKTYGIPCDGMKNPQNDEVYKKCKTCNNKNPKNCDEILGEPVENSLKERFHEVYEIERMSSDDKYDYWMNEFKKCIRCNACKSICPACNCETCVFENKDEDILGKANNESETGFYQIIRAYHVAGRCSDCGECERVCPAGIPLSLLNKKLIKDSEELYGEGDVLSTFDLEDEDTFLEKKGGK